MEIFAQYSIVTLVLEGVGHEQRGFRPALIISNERFQRLTNGKAIIVPITSKDKGFPLHIEISAALPKKSYARVDDVTRVDLRARKCKLIGELPYEQGEYITRLVKQCLE